MKNGFTLVEILVTMGVAAILISFATFSIVGLQKRTYLNSRSVTLANDLRLWQVKAMTGEADKTGQIVPRGIHFSQNAYTLFRGQTYNFNDPYNFTINLEDELSISNPNFDIIFAAGSGQIASAVNITLQQNDGVSKTIVLNSYGTVTQIN